MRILRTYPLRIQQFPDNIEMLVIDLHIDGKQRSLLLDTGAHDAVVLFEPASKPGRSQTRKGLNMDFSGTAHTVKMHVGPIATLSEALFLSKQQCNDKSIIAFRRSGISGFIGFYSLIKHFNTISYQDKQIQFIPESDLQKQNIFSIKRVLSEKVKITTDPVFTFEEEAYFIDTGSPITMELTPKSQSASAQKIIVKIQDCPIQFTFSGASYPTKILTKKLPAKAFLLGMDFMKRIGSFTLTNDRIYLNNIRHQGKNLACRFAELEVYKDTNLIIKDQQVPMRAGAKGYYLPSPLMPELIIENPN